MTSRNSAGRSPFLVLLAFLLGLLVLGSIVTAYLVGKNANQVVVVATATETESKSGIWDPTPTTAPSPTNAPTSVPTPNTPPVQIYIRNVEKFVRDDGWTTMSFSLVLENTTEAPMFFNNRNKGFVGVVVDGGGYARKATLLLQNDSDSLWSFWNGQSTGLSEFSVLLPHVRQVVYMRSEVPSKFSVPRTLQVTYDPFIQITIPFSPQPDLKIPFEQEPKLATKFDGRPITGMVASNSQIVITDIRLGPDDYQNGNRTAIVNFTAINNGGEQLDLSEYTRNTFMVVTQLSSGGQYTATYLEASVAPGAEVQGEHRGGYMNVQEQEWIWVVVMDQRGQPIAQAMLFPSEK